MVNSLNYRRGAATINRRDQEYKEFKIKLRENISKNILTSQEYFEYLDDEEQKPMNCKQTYYLDVAAKVALNSTMNHKHGAVIVYKKNIISVGYNHHTSQNICNSIHAEIDAISQLKGKDKNILQDCELYVVRIAPSKDNVLKYSKPCHNCQHFICKKNIKKIYYSTNYDYEKTLTAVC